ncbi:histidine phosphatase superfamily [Bombardia bombarda]|uniref:3-phytase n=1 Tax=Bombardia bombarda TaxID=252184 RepID=A0AA39XBE2_9PEZI|nr:histidine phosphatase superfamily [Bombardia bombarda]
MTTLVPRAPYTDEELQKLYPNGLELQLVQILMRHGERTPVSSRFQNAGLKPFWPYCASVRQMKSTIMSQGGKLGDGVDGGLPFHTLEWKRRLETFGQDDEPVVATGPMGELDNVCDPGGLTDVGRQSTSKLGLRLRELYVDRLKFLPPTISDFSSLYLRSTPIPRALESMHQAFSALYPRSAREPDENGRFPVPTILTRAPGDETLYPNDGNCRRFAALSRAFAQRTADRWNASEEIEYLNKLYGKWMPPTSPRVAIDSHPRLSGIMDSINSTLAHGPETKLPAEFYDKKGREIIEKIGVEEWFSGYKESREYRMLGIGGLLGDVVGRMVGSAEHSTAAGEYELQKATDQSNARIRFGISGCHDTTLAAILASLGAFNTNSWPPFTSHIAVEMFRKSSIPAPGPQVSQSAAPTAKKSWWDVFSAPATPAAGSPSAGIGRKPTAELTAKEIQKLDGYYVRLRYNDEPVTIPGCKAPGKHLEGDESFCTLAAFKDIVDKFTPQNWRQQCRANLDAPAFPKQGPGLAGF